MDYLRNIWSGAGATLSILLGLITVNDVAILIGILSGVSVIVERAISSIIKVKQYKKDVNRTDS